MVKYCLGKRGVALFAVLSVILISVILANVVLNIISSQSRLTHHKVSRIQAYYATLAGVNYALEMLRTGTWRFAPINSCPNAAPCTIIDAAFPASIVNRQFRVVFCQSGATCQGSTCAPPAGYNFCVTVSTNYAAP